MPPDVTRHSGRCPMPALLQERRRGLKAYADGGVSHLVLRFCR